MSATDLDNNPEEWKEVWDYSCLKAIAAFHNTDGGRLIVGHIDDGTHSPHPQPKDAEKKILDTIRNKLRVNANVSIKTIESKDCIVIEVNPGDRMVDLDGKFYVRVGNTNHVLEGEKLKTALLEENGLDWLDQTCNFGAEDLSDDAISFFISKGKKCGRISDSIDSEDTEGLLSSYGLRRNGKIAMAAVVAFAKRPRRLNDGAYVVIGSFDSKNVLRRETYVEVPGIQIVDETIRILYERYIPSKFEYERKTGRRIDVFDYPEDALRELIVNALVHKDYSIQEPTRVAIYPDHMEISSMGVLPKGWTTKDLFNHESKIRNSVLADIFFDAGYVDKQGGGIKRAVEACKANGNPIPKFSMLLGSMMAILKPRPSGENQNGHYAPLGKTDREILKRITANPSITQTELASDLGVSRCTISRHIDSLKANGFITREGSKKSGIWVTNFK